MTPRRLSIIGATIAVLAVLAAIATVGFRTYSEHYTVDTEGRDGLAVAKVVQSTLTDASELKVSTLTGTVQSTASDSRAFGMLNSTRVMKAPFEVEYFLDVSRLTPADFLWDASSRTLTVRAPDVRIGKVNVDESRTYLDRTSGILVTRSAMAAMQKQAAARADRVASVEAMKPDKLAAAQANARKALAALFRGPLRAAGIDATITVRFAGDPVKNDQHWDVTRSLEEVLGNRG